MKVTSEKCLVIKKTQKKPQLYTFSLLQQIFNGYFANDGAQKGNELNNIVSAQR